MPFAGKSTLAKLIADKLKWKLVDTDKLIEENEKESIEEIFKTKGEDYFRNLEKNIITQLKNDKFQVIAAGGGMPAFFNNMNELNKIGMTVFINAPLETIKKRAVLSSNRPLLKNDTEANITKLYLERINTYNKAHIRIDTADKETIVLCDLITIALKECNEKNNIFANGRKF